MFLASNLEHRRMLTTTLARNEIIKLGNIPAREHLLCQLRHRQGAVLLGAAGCQGRKTSHEEMQARERHQVHGDLAQIAIELAWKSQAASHAAHRRGDQVVQVSIGRSRQLQCPEQLVEESSNPDMELC